jgi:hypothetical protein
MKYVEQFLLGNVSGSIGRKFLGPATFGLDNRTKKSQKYNNNDDICFPFYFLNYFIASTPPGRLNLVAKLNIFVHLSLLLLCLLSRAEVDATGRRPLLTAAPPVQGVEVCGGPDPGGGLCRLGAQQFLCPAVLASAQQGQQLKHGGRCKGQCHEIDIFWKVLTFSSVLSVYALIKKKIKLSSYIRKFRVEQLQGHLYEEGVPNI